MSFIATTAVRKKFAGVTALDGVDFAIEPGEIRGLVGPNGAGKSSLAHILSGAACPDSGAIVINGSPAATRSVGDAQRLGICAAYQESQMMGGVSAAQYLMLGREPKGRFGVINERKINEAARKIFDEIGLSDFPAEISTAALDAGQKKFLEAARAIFIGENLAIFDEPTAGLAPVEAELMAALARGARDRGAAVLVISHDIPFVASVCDRVTVLRDGRVAENYDARETGAGEILSAIGGGAAEFPERAWPRGENIFSLPKAGLEIRAGETVGARVSDGAAKSGLITAIFGADPRSRGDVSIFGMSMRMGPPGGAARHRIGLSGDERKLRGSALYITVRKKIAYARMEHSATRFGGESPLASIFGGGRSDPLRETVATAQNFFEPSDALEGRSPGELMLGGVDAVIFDEPSRSADEPSKSEIYKLMAELARRGKGIILFSTNEKELNGLCDKLTDVN